MEIPIVVNGKSYSLSVDPETPLLWILRDELGLRGTKYGCGIGLCGSCTVHVDGEAVHSCTKTVASVEGQAVTTIEGLAEPTLHPIQEAWIAENVSQCGYCQSGQIMSAVALLNQKPDPSPSDFDVAMSGNLCRCGTYQRIRRAIEATAKNSLARSASEVGVGNTTVSTSSAARASLASSNVERYLPALLPLAGAIAFVKESDRTKISRRGFLQVAAATGAGLVIGISLPGCKESAETPTPTMAPAINTPIPVHTKIPGQPTVVPHNTIALPTSTGVVVAPTATQAPALIPDPTATLSPTPEPTAFFEPNVFLTIDDNGVATIVVHRVEMGQGARTALPMIVAEELEVEWSAIRVVQAPGDSIFGKQQTAGSSCIYDTYAPLRLAGAQARDMLIAAAAQIWSVDRDTCYAENGTVIHQPSGQVLAYGELVETASSLPATRGQLKDKADFKIIGTRIGHIDNPQIVDGSAVFGIDVMIPGTLYAAVARSPELRGTVIEYDARETEDIPGVRHVLPIESGIAVVADNTWAALQGKRALNITWEPGRYADLNSGDVARYFREQLSTSTTETNVLEALYEVSFLAHATPSPMNCAADVRSDGCDVWAPTQAPQQAKSTATGLAGLPSADVTLHVPRVGGGFGRRLQVDYVRDAVEISRKIGAPVKVLWNREDDIQHDYYHPLSVHHVSADLTSLRLPQIRSRTYGEWDQITGAWRSVSNFTEGFVRECFLDEMAVALEEDPLELRLNLLLGSFQSVLETAAEHARWGEPLPPGHGRGIAAYSTWGVTPVVMIADVSLENGEVRVHRVVTAIDCGLVINPDLVEAQMEGGIAWGLSALLGSEITIQNGQVQQSNFHDYPVLRFDQMPEVEVHIMPSDLQPMGVGEMGVPPIAPAVLNALYAVTGKRIRNLP
ncbi:MAG: molybdopterin cofactor-binding domain-containing protein, partial [Candidatus Promineifilaceae bacterium]